MKPDHYATLGVARSATPAEITHAYRRLIRELHPDTRAADPTTEPPEPDALQAVVIAYRVVGNPDRRIAYDRDRRPAAATPPTSSPSSAPTIPEAGPLRAGREPMLRAGPVRYHGPVDPGPLRSSPAPPGRPPHATR